MKINNENKCNPLKDLIELVGEYKLLNGTTVELTDHDRLRTAAIVRNSY